MDDFTAGRRDFLRLATFGIGAYNLAFGPEHASDPAVEMAVHAAVLQPLARQIKTKYPALEIETYLMALDGSVESLAIQS